MLVFMRVGCGAANGLKRVVPRRSSSLRAVVDPELPGAEATGVVKNGGSTVEYPNFSFVVNRGPDLGHKGRTGILETPHGTIETPNFVFCATKAAMKTITPDQLRAEKSQIILSNTYHLMLTPGSDLVEKMGGLQKFTGWRGPMLTDSGGYQIFSMGHGSVSSEIKGKRDTVAMGWNQTLLAIDEEGATFRSYVDGAVHHLTPERSMEIQRQLGADLIVVLDECTPFNVDKAYTEASMHRSHRWALRSLNAFAKSHSGKQALYGIIQGGIYRDLRDASAAYINEHSFFGTAIGGSLGADKQTMHDIVAYTRSRVRDDRPVHLLGIGGVRDVFHGVRQGIDTFDCEHPTRLGRHGGVLVDTAHWDEEPWGDVAETSMTVAEKKKVDTLLRKELNRLVMAKGRIEQLENQATAGGGESVTVQLSRKKDSASAPLDRQEVTRRMRLIAAKLESGIADAGDPELALLGVRGVPIQSRKLQAAARTVREHINVGKGNMRSDPRPIDSKCSCYTCRNFSRAYLHHLFKAKESIGGTLCTIHNVAFMNRLMEDIRTGIKSGTLDNVEKAYVHPLLQDSISEGSMGIGT